MMSTPASIKQKMASDEIRKASATGQRGSFKPSIANNYRKNLQKYV